MKLNDLLRYEKSNMNKIRYIMNYRIIPFYLLIIAICLIMTGILMEIDERRYTPIVIGLFVFIGVMTVVLLITTPLIRRLELKAEMNRYDFITSGIESKDIYDFSDNEVSLSFDKKGMYVGDIFYWYNHLKIIVGTSNYLNRIWITIMFYINENDCIQVPLNGDIINMIDNFNICLINRKTLDYIVNHKEEAFVKIYKTGCIL